MAIIKKTKKKTILAYWQALKKGEYIYAIGGNVNYYSHCEKTIWRFPKKLNIEQLYDPTIPLLGIYPKEMKSFS
jgi:hypothetical protein